MCHWALVQILQLNPTPSWTLFISSHINRLGVLCTIPFVFYFVYAHFSYYCSISSVVLAIKCFFIMLPSCLFHVLLYLNPSPHTVFILVWALHTMPLSHTYSSLLHIPLPTSPGAVALPGSAFSDGSLPLLLSSVNCSGSENSLLQCNYSKDLTGCLRSIDAAGVICQGNDESYARHAYCQSLWS